ncbi:hypothetical protein EMIHUDRAFT_253639 [Emiliania huxleyi CCMP1516]|uniref:Uncharacterized protein n=2 Tax=Emiliania huxleyi TaxID=2903 RepID=A0A0D3K4S7_EMIH1|nr:hypothetical protein EMIHUDRAFT_253639 [Emiliania huxleyi CCMP1516]EOD30762.1 hypothetical protein EMIHUDRAFT_253639 [Emiliania huxleyi CCMP1516]|eukprot:XP_005783191.1 hypothetical protein EMIHUDRAFT_253639 [Emiliania huxleyi CCMP1516]
MPRTDVSESQLAAVEVQVRDAAQELGLNNLTSLAQKLGVRVVHQSGELRFDTIALSATPTSPPAEPEPSPPSLPPSCDNSCGATTCLQLRGILSLVSGEVQVVAADGVSLAYPGTYGLHGCDSHDSGLEPSCNSTGYPGWCEHEWCYVDPTACNTEYSTTAYVVGATLHYSYRACGFSNEFESCLPDRH